MGSLLSVLLATIKSKITPIVTAVKRWTSWNFIKTQVISKIRDFFSKLLNVRPKNKKDYYGFFGLLVSKKLAYALIAVAGVLSIYYLVSVRGLFSSASVSEVKTYSYRSVMLRFTNDTVRIKAKDGHIAYEGEVAKGKVTGDGTLYGADGTIIYTGSFVDNCYEGSGTLYDEDGVLLYEGEFSDNLYDGSGTLYYEDGTICYKGDFSEGIYDGSGTLYYADGTLWYDGSFSDGLYDGEGKLYYENGALTYDGTFSRGLMDGSGTLCRENGTKEYEGGFSKGEKNGSGSLYGQAGSLIYTGNFSRDEIVCSELLGQKASEISEVYTGSRTIYGTEDCFAVYLEDVGIVYANEERETELEEEISADQIIVLSDVFKKDGVTLSQISELDDYFGDRRAQTADLSLAQAVAKYLISPAESDLSLSFTYEDYAEVGRYGGKSTAFLYEADGLLYTFVSSDDGDTFSFYMMEKGAEE